MKDKTIKKHKHKKSQKPVPTAQTNGKVAIQKKKKYRKKKKHSDLKPTIENRKPTIDDKKPTIEDKKPTIDDKKPTIVDKKSTLDDKRPKKPNLETRHEGDAAIVKCNKRDVRCQPVFSKDSKHILCPCGTTVVVYRCKTGAVEGSFTQHNYRVTNVYINDRNPTQVISCSSNEVLLWEYADLTLVKRYDVSFTALRWFVNPRCCEEFYYVRIKEGSEGKGELIKWNLNDVEKHEFIGRVSRNPKAVAVSNTGEHVAYAYKTHVFVHPGVEGSVGTSNRHNYITCVAIHPTQFIVCTGTKSGRIFLWHNLLEESENVCVKLHWHHHGIVDMVFSGDGSYLYSGGQEGVVVSWQLDTHRRNFIPRVGNSIKHLAHSDDNKFICVTLRNNMLKIINVTTMQLAQTIKYLSEAYELPAGLNYHSPTDCVVLNGIPDGVVQFYQPKADVVKLSVDLVGENFVSDVVGRYVYPTRVLRVAFSDDGVWMATVEERQDRLLPTERKLKFWLYSEEEKKYSLSTLVDPPHKGVVHSLCFRPLTRGEEPRYAVVTTSEDGEVKTWSLSDSGSSWQIHSVGMYGSNSCGPACFSYDGKTLAILFCVVTLWDPDTLTLNNSLEFSAKNETIQDISFACKESSDYLIGRSTEYLIVWNVKENAVVWMLNVDVSLILCDPYSRYCAAFVKPKHGERTTDLYVFDPVSPAPKSLIRNVLSDAKAAVSSALFVPPKDLSQKEVSNVWQETGRLYILTETTEIFSVTAKDDQSEEEVEDIQSPDEPERNSAFEDIFGISNEGDEDEEEDDKISGRVMGEPSAAFIRKMLSTPANVLPSADILCKAYVKTLLLPKSANATVDPVETNTNNDETEAMVEELAEESSVASTPKDAVSFAPSKRLLKKLRRYNFDFVQPIK